MKRQQGANDRSYKQSEQPSVQDRRIANIETVCVCVQRDALLCYNNFSVSILHFPNPCPSVKSPSNYLLSLLLSCEVTPAELALKTRSHLGQIATSSQLYHFSLDRGHEDKIPNSSRSGNQTHNLQMSNFGLFQNPDFQLLTTW